MKELEQAVQASVGKACGIAGFGIIVAVGALSFDPALAARWGAVLTLTLAGSLAVCASFISRSPGYLKQVWVLSENAKRRTTPDAQRVLNDARREAMLWFAAWSAIASALFATAGFAISLFQGS